MLELNIVNYFCKKKNKKKQNKTIVKLKVDKENSEDEEIEYTKIIKKKILCTCINFSVLCLRKLTNMLNIIIILLLLSHSKLITIIIIIAIIII